MPMWFNFRLISTGSSELIAAVYAGMHVYAINNCGKKSVLFRVNFVCGDWISCIGSFPFLSTPFIYHLFSSWTFQYTMLIIAAESWPLFFPIPYGGIAYANTVSFWFLFLLPCTLRPPQQPLLRHHLPSYRPPMPPLTPLPYELTCHIRPYIPDYG